MDSQYNSIICFVYPRVKKDISQRYKDYWGDAFLQVVQIPRYQHWIRGKEEMNESDPRSDVHYLGSSENKAWKKNSGLYGIWTHDLCDTGAALYQLS